MKQSELIQGISSRLGKSYGETEQLYNQLLSAITGILQAGGEIDFGEDFGRLVTRSLLESSQRTVVLKATKRFRKIINGKAEAQGA